MTVGEVARAVGVNPVRLARTFRRRYGMSLGTYTRGLRIDWAGRELRSSHLPLSTIAMQAGFADQSHFTRTFRRQVGVTPHRYREAAQG